MVWMPGTAASCRQPRNRPAECQHLIDKEAPARVPNNDPRCVTAAGQGASLPVEDAPVASVPHLEIHSRAEEEGLADAITVPGTGLAR